MSGGIQILKCHLVSVGGIGREWFKAAGLNVLADLVQIEQRELREKSSYAG